MADLNKQGEEPMSPGCPNCRILRSARAVVLECTLGAWRPARALDERAAQRAYYGLGFQLYAAVLEHQDSLRQTRELSEAEKGMLWDVYLARAVTWLRSHGVTWDGEAGCFTSPTRKLPPCLLWALHRHGAVLAPLLGEPG